MRADDLSPLLRRPARPELGYRQGTIVAWDPETFANTINIGGTLLENLPILSGPDALSYEPGQVVAVLRIRSQYAIIGRILVPGTGAGQAAVNWMTTSIASAVFANRIHSASVNVADSTTSDTYTDLPSFGPQLADVEITETGRALAFVSARIHAGPDGTAQIGGGQMSVEITGATSIDPSTVFVPSAENELGYSFASDAVPTRDHATATIPLLFTILNPGLHTFTAKYRVTLATDSGQSAAFGSRNLTVIAF